MNRKRPSFPEWYRELCALYAEYYPPNKLSPKDQDSWFEYYDEGFTPKEALQDEAQY